MVASLFLVFILRRLEVEAFLQKPIEEQIIACFTGQGGATGRRQLGGRKAAGMAVLGNEAIEHFNVGAQGLSQFRGDTDHDSYSVELLIEGCTKSTTSLLFVGPQAEFQSPLTGICN